MTQTKTAARPATRRAAAAPRRKAATPAAAAPSGERGGDVAKVFMSGRSQAVRLPKAYRFDTPEVTIKRVGRSVVLTPRDDERAARIQALFDSLGPEGLDLERPEPWPQADREPLDFD